MKRHAITLLTLSLLLGLAIALSFCHGRCSKEQDMYGTFDLVLIFKDKDTGDNPLVVGYNRYKRDKVDIYNAQGEPLGIHPDQSGEMNLYFLHEPLDRDEPLNENLQRTFYIFFEEGDYDTLNISYKIGLDDCHDKTQISIKIQG